MPVADWYTEGVSVEASSPRAGWWRSNEAVVEVDPKAAVTGPGLRGVKRVPASNQRLGPLAPMEPEFFARGLIVENVVGRLGCHLTRHSVNVPPTAVDSNSKETVPTVVRSAKVVVQPRCRALARNSGPEKFLATGISLKSPCRPYPFLIKTRRYRSPWCRIATDGTQKTLTMSQGGGCAGLLLTLLRPIPKRSIHRQGRDPIGMTAFSIEGRKVVS